MKTLKNFKVKKLTMTFEKFEQKYNNEIEMMVERILDTKDGLSEKNYEEMYDNAHEEAVFVLAFEKKVTLDIN